jgi:hypothetical protein
MPDIQTIFITTLTWAWWLVYGLMYVLYWTWPLYWITWPATVILLISARGEYLKSGGGPTGALRAFRYVLVNLPSTVRGIIRWLLVQGLMVTRWSTGNDVSSMLPERIKKWLGDTPGETKYVYVNVPAKNGHARTRRSRSLVCVVQAFEEIGTGMVALVALALVVRLFS